MQANSFLKKPSSSKDTKKQRPYSRLDIHNDKLNKENKAPTNKKKSSHSKTKHPPIFSDCDKQKKNKSSTKNVIKYNKQNKSQAKKRQYEQKYISNQMKNQKEQENKNSIMWSKYSLNDILNSSLPKLGQKAYIPQQWSDLKQLIAKRKIMLQRSDE